MTDIAATLVKRTTADGLIGVEDSVPLGTKYTIDPSTITRKTMFNTVARVSHVKQMVSSRRPGASPGWFPMELLSTEPPSITCAKCQMTSWNPNDVSTGYCGNCHEFTGRPT